MEIETRIRLDKFKPRDYQLPIIEAVRKGYKRILACWPRRAGKDFACFCGICIPFLLKRPCIVYYIFPTFAQAKRALWDSSTNTGERIIDFIPKELVESVNSQEMKIRFKNGSLFQLVGSDNYNSLMGTNPSLIIFSEYALQDPQAYKYLRPILLGNDGTAIFLSTPRGRNHFYTLYEIAKNSPEWFCEKLTVDDTKHVNASEIEKDRVEGTMSHDLILQEWYTSFSAGVEGSYYCKYIDRMRVKGQIGDVPWETGFKVHTFWDIGVRDATSIIFAQTIGQTVRIIDYYENNKEGLEHYVKVLEAKPYSYGKHIAPHDIAVREFGSGITRIEKARNLGINFSIAPDVSIVDGIEAVRSVLNKVWIDEKNCAYLIKALENYRQEWDDRRQVYKSQPLHDKWSNAADAMRYLAISLPKTQDGLSAEQIDRNYQEAMYGTNTNMPAIFRDDLPNVPY